MTIRKKILYSNILMLIIPVLIIASLGMIGVKKVGSRYWESLERMYEDGSGAVSVQSLIYSYQEGLKGIDWEQIEHEADSRVIVTDSGELKELQNELEDMGYHIRLYLDEIELYSNLTPGDEQTVEELMGDRIWTTDNLIAGQGSRALVKNSFEKDGETLTIMAVSSEGHPTERQDSYFRKYVFRFMILFLARALLVVLLTNVVLTGWITRSILKPLGLLSRASKEIRDGNLDTPLVYAHADEFGQVCGDFDEMRLHLKKSVEDRLHYENSRRQLISGISHDLRTPLTSIKGYVEGLIEGIADTPQKQMRYLRAIRTRAGDLERLIDSLSLYNRLDNTDFHYHLERRDLKEFLEEYGRSMREDLEKDQVDMRLELPQKPCMVLLDAGEFQRILDNAVSNSVKYREKPQTVMAVSLREDGKTAELRIRDDGPGVPDDCLERIFESFCRLDDARTKSGEGSGLGLAIVRQIVQGHGGQIHAENDHGLVLVITLPLDKREGDAHGEDSDRGR